MFVKIVEVRLNPRNFMIIGQDYMTVNGKAERHAKYADKSGLIFNVLHTVLMH